MSDIQKDKKEVNTKRTDLNLQSNFSSFLKNEHHTFTVLKSEKLAAALYMITGFVSESDPLRTRLRTCALDIVSCAAGSENGDQGRAARAFGSRCLEIGSLLGMAEKAGLVSSMNAKILCDEYASLAAFVSAHIERIFGGNGMVDVTHPPLPAKQNYRQNSYIQMTGQDGVNTQRLKRTNNYKRHQNRRQSILSLLNKKDKVTVKDVTNELKDFSEKTIQRELIAMVEEGVLIREGKRRWSAYKKAAK